MALIRDHQIKGRVGTLTGPSFTIAAGTTRQYTLTMDSDKALTAINGLAENGSVEVTVIQDGTGGRALTLPASYVVSGAIDATANSMSWLVFRKFGGTVYVNVQATIPVVSSTYIHDQTAHGFVAADIGKVFYLDSADGNMKLANADTAATLGSYILKSVPDANTLELALNGIHDIQYGAALTVGEYYFLSDTTAGDMTLTIPTLTSSYVGGIVQVLKDEGSNLYKVLVRDPDFSSNSGAVGAPTEFATVITTTPGTPITVTHALNKAFVHVTAYEGNNIVQATIVKVDNNSFTVDTALASTLNLYVS